MNSKVIGAIALVAVIGGLFAWGALKSYDLEKDIPLVGADLAKVTAELEKRAIIDKSEAALLIQKLVNDERQERGLQTVAWDDRLARASSAYAQKMIDDDFYEHVAPDGTTVNSIAEGLGFDCNKAPYYAVADNLAGAGARYGQTNSELVATQTVNGWMNSEGHRANILTPSHDKVGVGMALVGGSGYVVLSFC